MDDFSHDISVLNEELLSSSEGLARKCSSFEWKDSVYDYFMENCIGAISKEIYSFNSESEGLKSRLRVLSEVDSDGIRNRIDEIEDDFSDC